MAPFFLLSLATAISLALVQAEGETVVMEKTLAVIFLAALDRFAWRALLPVSSVLLFWLSFPPFNLPLYFVCYAPLVWLWRNVPKLAVIRDAFVPGFALIWVAGADLRGVQCQMSPVVVHAVAATVFGLQTIIFAVAVRSVRNWPPLAAAPIAAAGGLGAELLRFCLSGWPTHLLCGPAAPTPLAQWAVLGSSFGVSYFLYTLNMLCIPGRAPGWKRWLPPGIALSLLALAWVGGTAIARAVAVKQVPFTVLLVQPHHPSLVLGESQTVYEGVEVTLDRLTQEGLSEAGSVDLVVWPESALHASVPDLHSSQELEGTFTLQGFHKRYFPKYQTTCLVGLLTKYAQNKPRDSACLITLEGRLHKHDRLQIAALNEAPPPLMKYWPASLFWDFCGMPLEARLDPGERYQVMKIVTRRGEEHSLGISICYEVNFPWLPQYRAANRVDALIHLTDESDYRDYPSHFQHATWQCQYRAIETRTWQFVCARWSNSALINPKGEIVSFLGPKPGCVHYTGDN